MGGKESRSGKGSTILETKEVRRILPRVISSYACKSIVDAPCGDFHWQKEVQFPLDSYIGIDILP